MNGFVKSYFENIIPVSFILETGTERMKLGQGDPQFTVTMTQMPDKKSLLTSTSLALGEAYMQGNLNVDHDLYEVLDVFMGQLGKFTTDRKALKKLMDSSKSKTNQKKEVSYHYDIGNDFYQKWLDETMSYSCGYFKSETDSLYQAQVNKVDHILQKLHLEKGMTLLDIGCGWGFLLKRAAKEYGVRGVGITLSREQYEKFRQDIQKEGLKDLLDVRLMDYRELEKCGMLFDRVVSVGMLEHVGRGNYELFMKNVHQVLQPGGLFLLHFISGQKEYSGDAWMKKYIFPGGMLPSLREMIHMLPEFDFHTLDVESLRRHYNRTLLCWIENFKKCRSEVADTKGEVFARMWELYLASCAASFDNGVIDIHQILMSQGINNTLPMCRKE